MDKIRERGYHCYQRGLVTLKLSSIVKLGNHQDFD